MTKDYDYYTNIGYETVRDYIWDGLLWIFLIIFALPAMSVWYVFSVPFWLLGRYLERNE